MDHRREEHLGPDEDQQQGQALLEVAEPVHGAGQQEVQGPQAEDGERVGREHDEQVPGHAEHGRYRVQGKHQVRCLDGHQGDKQRCEHDLPVYPGEETAAHVVTGDREDPAQPPDREVLLGAGRGLGAEHPRPGQQDHRAEDVEDPADVLDERAAGRDEAAPHDQRAHDPQQQHPPLQPGRDRQRAQQQHEHEDVVDAERLFQQVPGEVLAGHGRALGQPQDAAEGQPGRDPQRAQHGGAAQSGADVPGQAEVHEDSRGEDGERPGPRPPGHGHSECVAGSAFAARVPSAAQRGQ